MAGEKSAIGRQLASLRKRATHVCPVCGQRFEGIKLAVYCSTACKLKAYRERHGLGSTKPQDRR